MRMCMRMRITILEGTGRAFTVIIFYKIITKLTDSQSKIQGFEVKNLFFVMFLNKAEK